MASALVTCLLVAVCLSAVLMVSASPSKKDSYGGSSSKKATSTTTKAPKKACDTVCPQDYTPVCASEKGSADKPKSFGNACVLDKYNCEHGTNLVKESDGECKNSTGVRLA